MQFTVHAVPFDSPTPDEAVIGNLQSTRSDTLHTYIIHNMYSAQKYCFRH